MNGVFKVTNTSDFEPEGHFVSASDNTHGPSASAELIVTNCKTICTCKIEQMLQKRAELCKNFCKLAKVCNSFWHFAKKICIIVVTLAYCYRDP